MKTKTINLIFILCLLFTACSTEQDGNVDAVTKEDISNPLNKRAGGPGNCVISEQTVLLEITYADGLSLTDKIAIRNQYSDMVGLLCITNSSFGDSFDETWICDEAIYNTYCNVCNDLNKCCKDVEVEGNSDVDEAELKDGN